MKSSLSFFIGLVSCVFVSCGGNEKKNATEATAIETQPSFDLTLSKSFYMTGDSTDDLYIDVEVNSGELLPNTAIEIVKKNNPNERISGVVYKVQSRDFKDIPSAKSGDEVVAFLRVKNDKGFALGYNGDEYTIVTKGSKVAATAATGEGMAHITVDGKEWKNTYASGYHYVKDNGVTKGPANIMLTFTKPNKNLKNTPEEVLQVNLYTASKSAIKLNSDKIDVSFSAEWNGKEKAFSHTKASNLPATAEITTYREENGKAYLSGKVSAKASEFTCGTCPKVQFEITFENIPTEIYNQ